MEVDDLMLLHIGENIYLDKDDIVMIMNPKVIYKKDSQTNLAGHKKVKHGSKRTKSEILVGSNVIHHSQVDSLTLYKRDEVLRFLNTNLTTLNSGGCNE